MVMRKFIGVALLLLACAGLKAEESTVIREGYSKCGGASAFVAGDRWLPVPEYSDRAGWAALFASDSASVVRRGEKYLDYQWQHVPATAYLEFERTGDRSAMEGPSGRNRSAILGLMLAELAEGKGRFMDQIANGLWFLSGETSWVLSAHQPRQASKRSLPDGREHLIDLGSGRMGAIVSLGHYLFHEQIDRIDPSITAAVERAVKTQILDPFLDDRENKAQWWNGFHDPSRPLNNWNPWCNSDSILCFLLMEKDPERLSAALDRSVRSVDLFMGWVSDDGACEEGPSYWGHAAGKLYDFVEILRCASHGRFNVFDNAKIRRMGEYISRVFVGGKYVVNFADGSAGVENYSTLTYQYGKAIGSRELSDFGLYQLADESRGRFRYPGISSGDGWRAVWSLVTNVGMRSDVDSLNAAGRLPEVMETLRAEVPSSTWYPKTEHCLLRNSSGWFLGAKGGHNNESHNHNDIGTFILYIRNIPVFVDAGVGTYTKDTFGKKRYTIWTMQCDWHNLPMPNSISQLNGRDFRSREVSCNPARGLFSLDISKAYPEESCALWWKRTYSLPPKGKPSLTITDNYKLSERTESDLWHFMVKGEVELLDAGTLMVRCDDGLTVELAYPSTFEASVEEKHFEDPKLTRVWGNTLRRITLRSSPDAPAGGKYTFRVTER